MTAPEDTVVAELEWYRRGGEVSQRGWADVIGILRAAASLDEGRLRQGAAELGVADLLPRALEEAGPQS